MKIDYDPEANAVYIQLRSGEVDDTVASSEYIFVDVDDAGVPLGVEILFADRVLAGDDIASVTVNVGSKAVPA
jgi:uncharacterized protein YuzE